MARTVDLEKSELLDTTTLIEMYDTKIGEARNDINRFLNLSMPDK